ncbi:hypothetical protein [Algibacter lectus]|uniref:hypothetical protein n=1 Tax=Algibacter lectus TaxID=221126 RepID=UPI0026F34DA8|nr:hypothetical protein [Algibacter lectus]MDO7138913.1 hypothetical protein [Algibacter lectus]
MKKATLILLILLGINCSAQNFEGIITYKVQYSNPNSKIVSDSIFYSNTDTTYIEKHYFKGNKYKFVAEINEKKEIELYNPNENRIYTYSENDDFASWTDSTKRIDEIVQVVKRDTTKIEHLGKKCSAVGFQLNTGQIFFAYSNELFLNAELYKNHKYDFWYDYLSITNSIPLIMKINTPWNKRTLKAIKIERTEISEDEFQVPSFETLIESVN